MFGLDQTWLDTSGGYHVPSYCSGGPIPQDIGIPECAVIGWSGVARLIPLYLMVGEAAPDGHSISKVRTLRQRLLGPMLAVWLCAA